jgi:hypothetical protein
MSQRLRHRELVLSLKYSTIEACFSVPMLNLTMPNLPFLLSYATAFLKWPSWGIGLLAALPHICNGVQPLVSRGLERHWSLHSIMRWGFVLSAIPWFFVGLSAHLPKGPADLVFSMLLIISTMANSVTSVAWSASISQVVPGRISGTYFGRRNLMFGSWTLGAVLLAGEIVDRAGNNSVAFACIFAAAGVARLLGLFFLKKMKFPGIVTERRAATFGMKDMLKPLLDRNYCTYMIYVGLWGLFLNMSLPFYTVFLIRYLDFNIKVPIIMSTLATLGGILTLRSWGYLADRFGNKPVQYVCSYTWILVGLAGWLTASAVLHNHLYVVYLIVGGATAGFQLTQFNLMLKLIPSGMGSLYIAIFLAVTSGLTALGSIFGGVLLALTPSQMGTFLGQPLMDYHILFLISFLGCLITLPLLTSVNEPASLGVQTVWRTMWRMRSFNPLLAMSNAAGFLTTPRGILSLGNSSIRSLRRQFKRVMKVGTELVAGGQDFIKERR